MISFEILRIVKELMTTEIIQNWRKTAREVRIISELNKNELSSKYILI